MTEENPPRARYTGTGNTDALWILRNVPDRNFEFFLTSHDGLRTFLVAEENEIHLVQGHRNTVFRYTNLSRELFTRFLLRPLPIQERKLVQVIHTLLNQIAQRSLHELHPWIPRNTHLPFEMIGSLEEICDKLGISQESFL